MSSTSTRETEISADPAVPLIRVIREFDAPAQKVFHAHVDPDLVQQWVGPRRHTTTINYWDARSGGSFRYVLASDGAEFGFHGSFHEVRPSDLIVQTFTFEGQPDGVALERIVFEDIEDGRSRLTATSLVDSFEARDMWLASGLEEGLNDGYTRLDEFLAG